MDTLDYICSKETIREIFEALPPDQLSAVALRWSGLNNVEIGDLLGCTHQAVALRLTKARRRLEKKVPETKALLQGRSMLGGRQRGQGQEKEAHHVQMETWTPPD